MHVPSTFTPSRAAAKARLTDFLPLAGRYAAERNFVREGHHHVARLSPWLQKRILLESEVVATVRAQWSFTAVEKFVQEVYWRTYWKGWLEQRPEAWMRWVNTVPALREGLSGERLNTWKAACAGRTGITCFDAWSQELVTTGYLHNHARMWFASIWIFTLRLPWELGADFFYEHLLDGDAASNTLSWRWVAGLQTPGKTYLARADNIHHYTDGQFAPVDHQLAGAAFAITEEPLPKIAAWTDKLAGLNTRYSSEKGTRLGLWIHAEDLATESGELADENFVAIHAAWPTGITQEARWGERVAEWTHTALNEGALRASHHFSAPVASNLTDDFAGNLVEWANAQKLTHVIAYRPFVGPWLTYALEAEKALAAAGIPVIWKRRQWDARLFPYTSRGYFPFWEQVKSHG
jgi:deoxyribodipyrimidine photo-lyase